jgi:hypothetical protein
MKYRRRIFFTNQQKSEIWDRWQRGESMSTIGRGFDRALSSIYPHLARTCGIRPPERSRSRLALTLMEREEISRSLRAQPCAQSHEPCVAQPQPSAARSDAMEVPDSIALLSQMKLLGIVRKDPSDASWQAMCISAGRYHPS